MGEEEEEDWTQTHIYNNQSGLPPSLVLPIPQPLMLTIAPAAPRILCSLAEC